MTSRINDKVLPVVLGTDINAYGIARSLHEAYGLHTLAIGRVASKETAHSRIIDVRTSPTYSDTATLIETIKELASEFPDKKLLVIPIVEAYTNAILEQRDQFGPQFLFPVPKAEVAARVYEKEAFYKTCEEYSVPYPRFLVVNEEDVRDRDFGKDTRLGFPVIVKPSNTGDYPRLEFKGREKIYLVQNSTELKDVATRIYNGGYRDNLIIQQYIHGDESVILSASTYSDQHGKVKLAAVGQVALTSKSPVLVGNNDVIVTTSKPEQIKMLIRLLEGIGYTGSANFDLMKDVASGEYKVLEMNLRQGASSYYTTLAGANIPKAYVEDLVLGEDLKVDVTTAQKLWTQVPRAIAWIFSAPSLRPLVRQAARNGTANTLWYWSDMSPKRFVTLLEILARRTMSTIKYHRRGINSWKHSPGDRQ